MVRQANVYHTEGSLENAYVLYLKFMTLFLERIRKHPEFHTVPIDVKIKNQAKLREVLPTAEKLRKQLLEQYTEDYNKYLAEIVSRSSFVKNFIVQFQILFLSCITYTCVYFLNLH